MVHTATSSMRGKECGGLRKPLNGGGRWSALGDCPTPPSSYSWYSVHVEGEYWVLGTGSLPATSPATPFEQIKPDYLLWGCSAGVGVGVLLVRVRVHLLAAGSCSW
jgi:hypothetical protein